MTTRTIRLAVVIQDPGEWCRCDDTGKECFRFDVTEDGEHVCSLGFRLNHDTYRRPQSCRDAEIRDGDP